ncbi:hypothetical protein EK21DRAFT_56333 [Setomelanomma holmii]|uniref:Rrn9 domain-containing protein n=1 Tax=Setomelanomma holmii TaxID=210430 RepID=A0A9P4HIV9_9PLEO|nr:hypothetical protein EK21DRAFT_56333 [Setomelanomma holmii]
MSLFGGDSAPPSPSSHETESEEFPSLSPQSSPFVEAIPSPPRAQHPNNLQYGTDSGANDDFLITSESVSENSPEPVPSRPNRFQGGASKWKAYTADDRQIAASLEQIQNGDLAAHLYNAHALKRRVRQPAEALADLRDWQSKERWLKRGADLEHTDASGQTQTNLVPTKEWTAWPLQPSNIPTPYLESERKGYGNERNGWTIGGSNAQDTGEELREELLATFLRMAKDRWNGRQSPDLGTEEEYRAARSRSRSRSKSVRSLRTKRSASAPDVNMKDGDDHTTDDAETHDEEEKFGHIISKKRGRKPQIENLARPTFLADEARALRTLQPTITSVMSKLDDLALAVRRTRVNHFGRGANGGISSQSEFTSDAESNPLDSDLDTDSDFSPDASVEAPLPAKRSRSESTAGARSSSVSRDETGRAGIMDWSEVLGLAAVKGWDDKVITRTAQRCAALFGESMSFMPLSQECANKPVVEPVQYTPATIPAPTLLRSTPSKRPLFRAGTLRCPHLGCYGHDKDFEAPYRVVQHCMRVHGYDPRTNDSDNEDRAVGGVHMDGFLQPIAAQRGWLERGRSRAGSERKKQKLDRGTGDSAAGPVTIGSD